MKFSINKEKSTQLAEELGIKVTFNSEKPGVTIKETGETFDFKAFFGEFFTEEEMDISNYKMGETEPLSKFETISVSEREIQLLDVSNKDRNFSPSKNMKMAS